MKRRPFLASLGALFVSSDHARAEFIKPTFDVTLPEAHKGTLEIDTRLLDSYDQLPANIRQFYFDARLAFSGNPEADFSDPAIVNAAQKHHVVLMGGPMLGDLRDDGVAIWLRPSSRAPLTVSVGSQSLLIDDLEPGVEKRIQLTGLSPNQRYQYSIKTADQTIATGRFKTAPRQDQKDSFRIAFGSCCHKIGIHNPNLFGEVLKREPHLMMLLGDIAVDDRNNEVNMHRADYQLRDVSHPWRQLVSNTPVFASWDDHDYFDNDLSGVPRKFTAKDRDAVRNVWHQNWVNPAIDGERQGIYFSSRIGPVELIMLDTRSYRNNKRRNQYGSYLGDQQLNWLKETLSHSNAPFKVISSGTMWSDYVSKAKDSWGSWDREAREELFRHVEDQNIGGVLLISGDRHGARAFRIPRPSGFTFYEFEPACLGGASGPAGIVKNCPEQLFGYDGKKQNGDRFVAFGEFTFETQGDPKVTFRLIDQFGAILEEHNLTLKQLTPAS